MANAFSASLVPRICKFVSETLLEDSSSFKAMISTSSSSSEGYFFYTGKQKIPLKKPFFIQIFEGIVKPFDWNVFFHDTMSKAKYQVLPFSKN